MLQRCSALIAAAMGAAPSNLPALLTAARSAPAAGSFDPSTVDYKEALDLAFSALKHVLVTAVTPVDEAHPEHPSRKANIAAVAAAAAASGSALSATASPTAAPGRPYADSSSSVGDLNGLSPTGTAGRPSFSMPMRRGQQSFSSAVSRASIATEYYERDTSSDGGADSEEQLSPQRDMRRSTLSPPTGVPANVGANSASAAVRPPIPSQAATAAAKQPTGGASALDFSPLGPAQLLRQRHQRMA
jgi:hypothetical protein